MPYTWFGDAACRIWLLIEAYGISRYKQKCKIDNSADMHAVPQRAHSHPDLHTYLTSHLIWVIWSRHQVQQCKSLCWHPVSPTKLSMTVCTQQVALSKLHSATCTQQVAQWLLCLATNACPTHRMPGGLSNMPLLWKSASWTWTPLRQQLLTWSTSRRRCRAPLHFESERGTARVLVSMSKLHAQQHFAAAAPPSSHICCFSAAGCHHDI